MHDIRGRLISVGDIIAYAVRRGSYMEMNTARVSEIDAEAGRLRVEREATSGYRKVGQFVNLTQPSRLVIVEKALTTPAPTSLIRGGYAFNR